MTYSPLALRHGRLKTHIAPVDHALKAAQLQGDRTLRMADAALAVVRLGAQPDATQAWEAIWAIGDAAWRRFAGLQTGWVDSWFEWLRYASTIDSASTMSKLSERELNIVNQAVQLVSEQSVSLLTLWENVEVDVLHWISAHAGEPPAPPVGAEAPRPQETLAAE